MAARTRKGSFDSSGGKWFRWAVENWKVIVPLGALLSAVAGAATVYSVAPPVCPDCPRCFECPEPEAVKAECVLRIDRCLDWISDSKGD